MSGDSVSFQEKLESVYQAQRQQDLESELIEIADIMEETILEIILAETLFDVAVEIDSEVKQTVYELRRLLEKNAFEELGATLPDVKKSVEEQNREVTTRVHQARIEAQQTVQGMRRLNERVDRVEESKLDDLRNLLEHWNWQAEIQSETVGNKKVEVADLGREMLDTLETTKKELFGPYRDTPLESLVDRLLDDERLTLGSLSDEEVRRLADSDLAEYLELNLS